MGRGRNPATPKTVEAIRHEGDRRANIPTAEWQAVIDDETKGAKTVPYPRNRDLDPQLMWRGKDEQDWSDLVVQAPPLYIQEKVHPKALIDDLLRQSKQAPPADGTQIDLFGDFNGIPEGAERTDFYKHDQNWTNRMILGDSLQVMASLAEREGLRGKVQCIYLDPPYGIKFNSNFQWSTTSRDVKDGNREHISREPEQVKAFRDTWRDGIHSYLTYLRDRLSVARDLLTDSGSIFVQIGDENVHRVRALMDEVFGDDNMISQISFVKTSGQTDELLASVSDHILWYGKDRKSIKYRQLYSEKVAGGSGGGEYQITQLSDGRRVRTGRIPSGLDLTGSKTLRHAIIVSQGFRTNTSVPFKFRGKIYDPGRTQNWKSTIAGMRRLGLAERLEPSRTSLSYVRFIEDFPVFPIHSTWTDTGIAGRPGDKVYVFKQAQTSSSAASLWRLTPATSCPTRPVGPARRRRSPSSGAAAWITIDTSRVALALARARIMGARYPYYLLADSPEGQRKEAEVTRSVPASRPAHGDIRHGFVYERVPHITLKSIANNAEIDVIWEKWEETLAPLREQLSVASGLKETLEEWEVPREAPAKWPELTHPVLARFWEARIARQKEIDASIAAKAESEYLYDRPYQDNRRVRVAGPFTVESLSPHRMLGVDENDELIDGMAETGGGYGEGQDFASMILENLRMAGVQQAHKEGRIQFTSLVPWPGEYICAEGRFVANVQWPVGGGQSGDGTAEKRAAIFIGPEFGTVSRPDLVDGAREAADGGFDLLISCAFNYDAHSTEFERLGRVPILKARMNADLHMAGDLKPTASANLFVIFGEPDIELLDESNGRVRVKVNGVDIFKPQTGEVESSGTDGIACWFIDTDYNGESFFVRHAYFLGQNDPYKSLKTTLKAEIDEDAWASLNSDTSRPFDRPSSGRIAVKVINHLGDEVMKVFRVN